VAVDAVRWNALMRKRLAAGAVATATVLASILISTPGTASAATATEYTVVADDGVSVSTAVAAIKAAGGTVVSRNDAVGVFRVTSARSDFATRVAGSSALVGASPRRAIGYTPKDLAVERPEAGARGGTYHRGGAKLDPLDDKLWGMKMIRADEAHKIERGERGVTVGVLDTGIDATNPDLTPNFSRRLSRNFAPDLVDVDGPCEVASCLDPVGTDDGGHGTHVAGIIGAAANGVGVSGVAPKVTLVELKGGQDSGYFFLEPTVNALTYAGDVGIDVVNMSFYVDPWLYNCTANPADTRGAGRAASHHHRHARALQYAHRTASRWSARSATTTRTSGAADGRPARTTARTAYPRRSTTTCWDLPVEGPHVIGVSALGPSGNKSTTRTTASSRSRSPPGRLLPGRLRHAASTGRTTILSTYPLKVLQEEGTVDANGNIVPGRGLVFKDCTKSGVCGYYTYLQGTSMASPHVAGVAALVASRYGHRDHRTGGLAMSPNAVERRLNRTAAEHACPEPRLVSYVDVGRTAEFDAYCAGGVNFNGFYGYGIVDAYAAVGG
jgi:subtilisin family serine protease